MGKIIQIVWSWKNVFPQSLWLAPRLLSEWTKMLEISQNSTGDQSSAVFRSGTVRLQEWLIVTWELRVRSGVWILYTHRLGPRPWDYFPGNLQWGPKICIFKCFPGNLMAGQIQNPVYLILQHPILAHLRSSYKIFKFIFKRHFFPKLNVFS